MNPHLDEESQPNVGTQQGVAGSGQPSVASESGRQHEQHQQQSEHLIEPDAESETLQSERSEHQQEPASSCSADAPQYFQLHSPADLFEIGSDQSNQSDGALSEPDDQFWWAELAATDAQDADRVSGVRFAPSPRDEARPAKRHRPG